MYILRLHYNVSDYKFKGRQVAGIGGGQKYSGTELYEHLLHMDSSVCSDKSSFIFSTT